jgi:PiT family inorganic phosphate transporter
VAELVVVIGLALAFALTNGYQDAANSIATLVATRGARPGQGLAIASLFGLLGALLVGTTVASTIAGLVALEGSSATAILGSGLAGAIAWNLVAAWKRVPASAAHALVGGLVGAALASAGPGAVNWGWLDGWRPAGVGGTLIALAVAPLAGLATGLACVRLLERVLRRATRRFRRPIATAGWTLAAAVSLGQGANDAQKTMGVLAALLLAEGRTSSLAVPLWVKLAAGTALSLGIATGGWRIVATIGRRIFALQPIDSVASQVGSALVILTSSAAGAPISSTQVVASSVVGVGAGRRRWRHVRWRVVQELALAWLTTIPAAGMLGAGILVLWTAV